MSDSRFSKRLLSAALVGALLLLSPGFALAQGSEATGEVHGRVVDPDGAALPGATVTVRGESLIQESVSRITGETGVFRFRALRPGTYTVTVDMPGFNSTEQSVRATVTDVATLSFVLSLAGVEETITVTGETPLIEAEESSLTTSFSEELIQNIPIAREFIAVAEMTAGIADNGAYGAGGNVQSEGTGRYRRGSAANAYRLNGVDVTEPDWGATWINPSVDTIAEVQVVGIGASAEYGNFTGAAINLITKGGTNVFHGGLALYHQGGWLRTYSDVIDDFKWGEYDYDYDISGHVGGPLIRGRLLGFGNISRTLHKEARFGADESFGAARFEDTRRTRYHGRLDFLINDRNTIGAMYSSDPGTDQNLGRSVGSGPEIGYNFDFGSSSWLASWQSQFTDNTYFDFRYAGYLGDNIRWPLSCNAPGDGKADDRNVVAGGASCSLPFFRDWRTRISYLSSAYNWDETNGRHEINMAMTNYVDDFLGGAHTMKVGFEYEQTWSLFLSDLGGGWISVGQYDGYSILYGSQYNAHLDVEVKRFGAYAQDDVKLSDNIALNIGVRFDNPQIIDVCCERTNQKRPAPTQGNHGVLTNINNLAPRLGINWDVTGEGKVVAHAGWGRYFEKALSYGPIGTAGNAFENVEGWYAYLPYNFDYDNIPIDDIIAVLFQPENIYGSFVTEPHPLDPDLRSPRTDAYNVGVELELSRNYALGLDYIYKDDNDLWVVDDLNEHTYEAVQYTHPSGNWPTQTLYVRTDNNPEVTFTTNDDYYFRRHHLAILELTKRPNADFNFRTSLTYQSTVGNIGNTIGTNWAFAVFDEADKPNFNGHPFTVGPLNFDRTWQYKFLANMRLPWDVLGSVYFTAMTGRPWNAIGRARSRDSGYDFNDSRFRNIRLEPRGTNRNASLYKLDLRVQKTINLSDKTRVEAIVDIFNATNSQSPGKGLGGGYSSNPVYTRPEAIYPLSGEPAFGKKSGIIRPREVRLGFRIAW